MTCNFKYDDQGNLLEIACGPPPAPTDHKCDNKGPMRELETGMGNCISATCSMCGRPAFQMFDIW